MVDVSEAKMPSPNTSAISPSNNSAQAFFTSTSVVDESSPFAVVQIQDPEKRTEGSSKSAFMVYAIQTKCDTGLILISFCFHFINFLFDLLSLLRLSGCFGPRRGFQRVCSCGDATVISPFLSPFSSPLSPLFVAS